MMSLVLITHSFFYDLANDSLPYLPIIALIFDIFTDILPLYILVFGLRSSSGKSPLISEIENKMLKTKFIEPFLVLQTLFAYGKSGPIYQGIGKLGLLI